MKKWISCILTLALLLGLVPQMVLVNASAADTVDSGTWGSNITWTLDSAGTLTLSGTGGTPFDYITPWDDYKSSITRGVIEEGIGGVNGAVFTGCSSMTSVSIGDSVTQITNGAFANCSSLKELKLPYGLKNIGDNAFGGCSSLVSLDIPDTVTSIGNWAFANCSKLSSLELSSSLTSIGIQAFSGCKALNEVAIPPEVSYMGQSAFGSCPDLSVVYWPLSLTSVDQPFHSCENLTVYYEGSADDWSAIKLGYLVQKVPENTTVHYNAEMPDFSTSSGDKDTPTTQILTPVLDEITNPEEGLTISWLRPLNTEDVEYVADGYYVYRKTAGGSYSKIATLSGIDNTSYTDTNVTHGTVYTYTVAAYYNGQTGSRDETGLTTTFVGHLADVTTEPLLPEDPLVRGNGTTAYINDHVYFAQSEDYYDRMDSRFSGLLLEDQTGMDKMAAEMLYLLIDSGASISKLEFQKLCVFKNPYEAVLAEILLNLTDLKYDSSDDCSFVPLEVAKVAKRLSGIVYAVQPDYQVPEGDLLPWLEELVEDPKTMKQRSPALYASLGDIFQKYMDDEGAEAFLSKISGSEKFFSKVGTAVDILSDGMSFVDWYQKSCQFVVMTNTYAALTQECYDALYQAAGNMTNSYYQEMLYETLDKLESCTHEDVIGARLFAEIYSGSVVTLYEVVASDAMYLTAVDLVASGLGISVNTLNAGVIAYNFGWTISNALNDNDKVVAAREYIRADAYLAEGAYNVMASDRQKLLSTKGLDEAKAFDASYRLLRALETHALNAYEEYLDASQKSFGQYLLHFGDTNANGYELAIAGLEIVRWDTAMCHGVTVYASPTAQILVPKVATANVTSGSKKVLQVSGSSATSYVQGVTVSDAGDAWLVTLPADAAYSMKLSGSGDLACAVTVFDEDGSIRSQAVYNGLSSGSVLSLTKSGSYTVKQGGTTVPPTQQPAGDQQVLPEQLNAESTDSFHGKMVVLDADANVKIARENLNSYVMTIEGGTVVSKATWLEDITVEVKDGKQYINILDGWYTLHITGSSATDIVVMDSDESGKVSRTVTFDDVMLSNEDVKLSVNCDAVGQKYTLVQGSKTIQPTSDTADLKLAFVDVKSSDYFYDPVRWAVANGITSGTSSTTFSPHQTCTRAQAVTFLWRAAGSPEPESTKMPFTDVAKGSYYYKAVLWAVEQGITSGTSANIFSPNTKCTRAQIVTFLWRADDTSPEWTGPTGFSDVSVSAYYWFPVRWAVKEGITSGTSATTFSPNADCTRAQIVTFLYRALAT